eukprot:1214822-Prymnesium_polylepis.1
MAAPAQVRPQSGDIGTPAGNLEARGGWSGRKTPRTLESAEADHLQMMMSTPPVRVTLCVSSKGRVRLWLNGSRAHRRKKSKKQGDGAHGVDSMADMADSVNRRSHARA